MKTSTVGQVAPDPVQMSTWLRALYGLCDPAAYLEFTHWVHPDVGGDRKVRSRALKIATVMADLSNGAKAAETLARLVESSDVYAGTCTLVDRPAVNRRGMAAKRVNMPALWLDLDIGTVGHAGVKDLRRLVDGEEARALLASTGLPEPTTWTDSGGGRYAWWLLEEPLSVDRRTPHWRHGKALAQAVNDVVVEAGKASGIKVDDVADLARVLRIPGSVNWKLGMLGGRPVRWLPEGSQRRYSAREIAAVPLVRARVDALLAAPHNESRRAAANGSGGGGGGGESLWSAIDLMSWEDVLRPVGWVTVPDSSSPEDTAWLRVGTTKSAKSAVVYGHAPYVIVAYSESSGLPTGEGQRLTKARVVTALWFEGNQRAMEAHLVSSAVYGGEGYQTPVGTSWPRPVLEAAHHVVMERAALMNMPWVQEQRL